MIDLETARELLDFGARIPAKQLAEDQLIDAVAVHNLLEREGVVYLANEPGTGKTLVALGAWALAQHFNPSFRVLVIAPRKNIQEKWIKEMRNFVASNVRFADLRVKSLDGRPARQLVACDNLLGFLHEVVLNRDRDFFLRLSSFSLPVKGGDRIDPKAARKLCKALREHLKQKSKDKRSDEETSNFDDADQARNSGDLEREGIDVADVDRLAKSYRNRFHRELPHPKMDALVNALAASWQTGNKSLVFVRRIASVTELKRKLDERYDQWLIDRLRNELPEQVRGRFGKVVDQYYRERLSPKPDGRAAEASRPEDEESSVPKDRGGTDSFFAWFFRGDGPPGVISGANIQGRFVQRGATYATFFEDNYVADILGCAPGSVESHLASALGVSRESLRSGLRQRSARFLSPDAKKHARADRFEAVQAAAVEWLAEQASPYQDRARIVWHARFQVRTPHAAVAPEIGDWLELRTFFTELRQRPQLRRRLWPVATMPKQNPGSGSGGEQEDRQEWFAHTTPERQVSAFRTRELRSQMLAAAARLGHAFIDLYVMTIRRLGSLDQRAQEQSDATRADAEVERIGEYLDLLEHQMRVPREQRHWGAFDELADLAENFELILDVNRPEVRTQPLSQTVRKFGTLFGTQQPVGGMSGQINDTLVRQFRLPGYPLVLISTDLVQEGEDLHTFCSGVHHYGIAWNSSARSRWFLRFRSDCRQLFRYQGSFCRGR